MLKLSLPSLAQYLKRQLLTVESIAEIQPDIVDQLIEEWFDYLNMNADFEYNSMIEALEEIQDPSCFYHDALEETIEMIMNDYC